MYSGGKAPSLVPAAYTSGNMPLGPKALSAMPRQTALLYVGVPSESLERLTFDCTWGWRQGSRVLVLLLGYLDLTLPLVAGRNMEVQTQASLDRFWIAKRGWEKGRRLFLGATDQAHHEDSTGSTLSSRARRRAGQGRKPCGGCGISIDAGLHGGPARQGIGNLTKGYNPQTAERTAKKE